MKIKHEGFWRRLTRGSRWSWSNPRFQGVLPDDLEDSVMSIESRDRLHAKQGRSTARVVFHGPGGELSVYLKRHYRLPWTDRVKALVNPSGGHTPGAAEFRHLASVRSLGVEVPEVAAAGESIGPWGRLQSFLIVAELTGRTALNEILPDLVRTIEPPEFETLKRSLIAETAEITAKLHAARVFHKDLYLCHFFLDPSWNESSTGRRLTLIDLHRLGRHHWFAERWRAKDLGQLLYSTFEVEGIEPRDRLRFWVHYQRALGLSRPRLKLRAASRKAARYAKHNRD